MKDVPTSSKMNTPLKSSPDFGNSAKGDMSPTKTAASGNGKPENTGPGAGNKPPACHPTTDMQAINAAANGKGKQDTI